MRIIDLSPLVSPRLAVWPGDTPYQREVLLSQAAGAHLDLSTIRTTVHLGAHTDAPNHYVPDGVGIAERSLSAYLGPCEVIRVHVARGARIAPLPRPPRAPRVLLRTDSFPDPEVFSEDFAALSVELVHQLADAGVVLVGIDTPSVDLCHDADLLAHHAIAERDLHILEGIVLDGVADGLYTLVALPLRLESADASPVRAVLLDHAASEGPWPS